MVMGWTAALSPSTLAAESGVRYRTPIVHDRNCPRHGARRRDRPGVGGPADGKYRGRGRGTIGDDVRDATGRVPILWFQDTDEHETPRQRFHIDVWVPPEVAEQRIAAAVAAGGIVVDDGHALSYTVIGDQDGNKACVCTTLPAAHKQ
jgi:hypothetical protein